jgi:hypothetical protein
MAMTWDKGWEQQSVHYFTDQPVINLMYERKRVKQQGKITP